MSFFEYSTGTSYYRSKDPLENFKIKVRIKKVALGTLWSSEAGFHDASDRQGEETYVFAWQEKIFSKRELQQFSDAANCTTVQEKAYHEQLAALTPSELKKHGRRIFSLVDADSINTGTKGPMTDDADLPETYFAGQIVQYRPRRPRIADLNVSQRRAENVAGIVPPSKRNGQLPTTEMHLMADFSIPPGKPSNDSEYILCSISIDTDGLIRMEPDFNAMKRPYLIQTGQTSGEMYEYFIEHASDPMARIDMERESQLFRALYQRHQEYNAFLVGTQFKMPPKNAHWISLFGEIIDGEGFEYDDLFVHFLLDVPSGCKAKWDLGKEPSHLSTQISMKQSDNRWHFGCPFAWLLESEPVPSDALSRPQLLIEVVSVDSWNRYRIEGYGYANIPESAGNETTIVHTWRPVGDGIISQLRRFFIGGCPELDDISYVSVPSDFQGKELSRYGFRTTPSGKIRLRLNTVTQMRAKSSTDGRAFASKARHGPSETQYYGMDKGVEDVLQAFKRARRRLLEARGILAVD
ncbi:Meckel syndrome type 1 protein [Hypsibius exemplaris]|uniref:Meckel syndrome type 1 protein n=1 Tax=Hypsibius exemplaris TaxID=2072580 RepID=A0A1W0WM23_HYPEX|nr:Meckel syndrome type 1 protein [Hypsibius exemplaris]